MQRSCQPSDTPRPGGGLLPLVLLAATGCGVGRVPRMPGTLGTLAALPLCYLLAQLRPGIALIATLGLVLAAIPIAERARKVFRGDDPGCIVIDEIAGMALTLLWLPPIPSVMAAAFVLFRMLDILKPWPIAWVDRHVRGGLGIVGDDVLAGAIANLTMRAALLLFGI